MPSFPNMTSDARVAYDEALKRVEVCRQREHVKTLDLSGLGLSQIPQEIGQLSALTELDLGSNQLTSLPLEIGRLSALRVLYLGANQLSNLPSVIGQLSSLTELYLGLNELKGLPPEIGQLSALTELFLQVNPLTSLPTEIGQLSSLKILYLAENRLTSLPPQIGRLSALTELQVSNNQLRSLPPEIGQLSSLTHLHLYNNHLTSLPREIGQLSSLKALHLSHNHLISLPPEIGQLTELAVLDVGGNLLPAELLKLNEQGQLIAYLRGLATKASAACFNEAKLLLVGPGNVGKSWLLEALQGHVPKAMEPTKGMEISRQPVTLPHPQEEKRQLCLNAWDFGGQEHYQITHQIFYSAKAVYLLVWKPRNGVDPDLIARLERIQLSAGRTAKVLIVSTHADGIVPAVIGKDALQERFGDMIGGFYEVDSAKGPGGTGIAVLRGAIAQAAAQLEGMDTPFPETWHEAQAAIRKRQATTLTFHQFAEACCEHGLDLEASAALATIMEVQGHAVYFADAVQDAEACLNVEENLIVLDPEWLAKAVGFVLEDKPTMQHSGVLHHDRLVKIWREDAKRHCPGYDATLHGFLLWLMWKFDIAYKQTEHTSLVPELIQRNRPDDLRWTPVVTARGPEATLICRLPQDPPLGMIPALTAAVHPLRRPQPANAHDQDKLDRNWRDGFFLDTASRGEAFVELVDRELKIVVRDEYPSNLSNMIQRTLAEIVKQRWPRLEMDHRVPCIGKVAGRPCHGTFRKSRLEERRGQKVYCEECGHDVDADLMLEGFDAHEQEVMLRLHELRLGQNDLREGQRALMAASYRFFQQALDPVRQELLRAPCMLTVLPEEVKSWHLLSRLTEHKLRVTCWCEHPDGPHPAVPIGSGEPPDYVLTMPQKWLVEAAPYITWAGTLLKAFVPLAGNLILQGLGADASADWKTRITLMNDVVKALPSGELKISTRQGMEKMHGTRAEIVALRHVHDALLEHVKPAKRWGDLRAVNTKSGEVLWLCEKHAAIQQPPVQQL